MFDSFFAWSTGKSESTSRHDARHYLSIKNHQTTILIPGVSKGCCLAFFKYLRASKKHFVTPGIQIHVNINKHALARITTDKNNQSKASFKAIGYCTTMYNVCPCLPFFILFLLIFLTRPQDIQSECRPVCHARGRRNASESCSIRPR